MDIQDAEYEFVGLEPRFDISDYLSNLMIKYLAIPALVLALASPLMNYISSKYQIPIYKQNWISTSNGAVSERSWNVVPDVSIKPGESELEIICRDADGIPESCIWQIDPLDEDYEYEEPFIFDFPKLSKDMKNAVFRIKNPGKGAYKIWISYIDGAKAEQSVTKYFEVK